MLCTSVCTVNVSAWLLEPFAKSACHSSALAGKFDDSVSFRSVLTFSHMFIAISMLFSVLHVSICVLNTSAWLPTASVSCTSCQHCFHTLFLRFPLDVSFSHLSFSPIWGQGCIFTRWATMLSPSLVHF